MAATSLQEDMLEIIGSGEMSIEDLVAEMEERHPDVLTMDIRTAIMPLLSSGEIEVIDGIVHACSE